MPGLSYEVDTPLSHRCCTRDHSPTRHLVKLPSAGLLVMRRLVKLPSPAADHSIRRLLSSSVEVVGLLVAIARERSEAYYLGYVFCTYGTEVPICLIGIWREAPDSIRATRFSGRLESG